MPGGYGVTISALTWPAHSRQRQRRGGAKKASRGERTWRVKAGRAGEQAGARRRRRRRPASPKPRRVVAERGHEPLHVGAAVAVGHVEHDVERVGGLDGDAVVVAQDRLELVAGVAEVARGDREPRGVELGARRRAPATRAQAAHAGELVELAAGPLGELDGAAPELRAARGHLLRARRRCSRT